MTTDLRDALRSLHDDARRDAADLPTRPLVARARRRRTLVRTGYGAAGIGTAAAVAVGGVALSGRLGRTTPPPPAVTTTAPAPSPSATHAAGPSPTPSWTPTAVAPFQPDLSLCSTTIHPFQADSLSYSSDEYSTSDPGQPLATMFDLEGLGRSGERATLTLRSAVLALPSESESDIVEVVGVAAAPLPGPAARVLGDPAYDIADGSGHTLVSYELSFVMCPGAAGAGGPPPLGQYVVWTQAQLAQGTTTRSGWGSTYVSVGPLPDDALPTAEPSGDPSRTYLAPGTVRLDSHLDQSWCGMAAPLAGVSSDTWVATAGPLTAQAGARIDAGNLVVALRLTNAGTGLKDVEVRYPTYYVVNDNPIPDPYDREGNQYPFPARSIMHVGNVGVVSDIRAAIMGGPTPSWAPRATLAGGASLLLETDAGPHTCTTAYGTPWPTGTYTVYAYTEVSGPDGSTTRVQAAPVALVVP